MNFQNPIDPTVFDEAQPLEDIYSYKSEAHDKTNHPPISQNQTNQYQNIFQISPCRGSFFFTPTSPKPIIFQFNGTNYQTTRRSNRSQPNLIIHGATISKKINLEEEQFDEKKENFSSSQIVAKKKTSPNRSSKNAKGLRNLSQSVYMIVSELTITKYKEVADRLVKQIVFERSQIDSNKDQHNVKRRVYDALNVLIAAGLLRKEGKEVVCNEPYPKHKTSYIQNSNQIRQKQRLQQEYKEKCDALLQKQQKLLKMQQKKNLIEYIIKRNKLQRYEESKIMKFPLIGAIVNENALSINVVTSQLMIAHVAQIPLFYGDVDLILQINKERLEMDDLLKNICLNERKGVKLEIQH